MKTANVRFNKFSLIKTFISLVMIVAIGITVNAEESNESISDGEWKVMLTGPGVKVISEEQFSPMNITDDLQSPEDAAQDWMVNKQWEQGRNYKKGKLIYISVGAASVNAKPDDPGYIDSRFLAYQRAELEAKAKTALFMGVDLTTERGSSEREINPQERAALEEIVNASPTLRKNLDAYNIKDKVYRWFEKGAEIIDQKLDRAIEDSGGDPAKTNKKMKEQKKAKAVKKTRQTNLSNISEASFKAAASSFSDLQGTQVFKTFEGSYRGNYQVVVVTMWSLNLQKIADSMQTGQVPLGLSAKKARAELKKQLQGDASKWSSRVGVHSYINQDGENVILAYGQSGVNVIAGRADKAFELAGKKAKSRAYAAMRSFMSEKVAFTLTEELREVLALYANDLGDSDDDSSEYKAFNQLQETIKSVSEQKSITGVFSVMKKEIDKHPFTGKPVVIQVMGWSPSSQKMAKQMKNEMKPKKESLPKTTSKKVKTEYKKGIISSDDDPNDDAY